MSTADQRPSDAHAHTPAYGAVDLTTCDREPIHVPGAIQPHGLLLAVDDDLEVVVVSGNSRRLIGQDPADVVGRPLADVLGPLASRSVQLLSEAEDYYEPVRLALSVPGGEFARGEVDVILHRVGERVVIEMEPRAGVAALRPVSYRSARGAVLRLTEAPSVDALIERLAVEIRAVNGFDRVMVYRFDKDWNGEVIAEEKREDLNSFLGLHYPASDIPAQARRLYTTNWTRLIVDIGYEPVPLHPVVDPGTGRPLDQSHGVLRSVSPIHIEYLQNMGVTASMSVSLIVGGELWGLVACHHYSGPHRPSLDARSAAEFLGQSASALLTDRLRADAEQANSRAQAVVSAIIADIADDPAEIVPALLQHPKLLDLFEAGGAAAVVNQKVRTVGQVPDHAALQRVADLLYDPDDAVSATDAVARLDPSLAAAAPTMCGALRIGHDPDRWLLIVRPEILRVVDWGGDPRNKAIALAEGPDVRLSPRKSFEKWQQEVRGTAEPWQEWHLEAARALDTGAAATQVRRSQGQVRIAESLQRSVVPEVAVAHDGVDIAGYYRPAAGGQLGGDWWDTMALDDGRIAVIVGDVSGHGVRAATAMTQVRMALRAYLIEGRPIAECLDSLDAVVTRMLDGHTATVLVAAVDTATRQVELASAGHLPPMVVGPRGGRSLELPARPLLGVGVPVGESHRIVLDRDEVLVLYTDGIVEERRTPIDESIAQAVDRAGAGPAADQPLDVWLQRLLSGGAVDLTDDRTAVAVRIAGR